MQKKKLDIVSTLGEGFSIGLKNLPSLFIASLLYILTLWIPYLNVGTTIAMYSIPGRLAKGEIISPTFIFENRYRKNMALFLLLMAFVILACYLAAIFLFVPAIVVGLSLSLSYYIFIDEEITPTEALRRSNEATYGNKWRIFFVKMLFAACFMLAILAIAGLTYKVIWLCILLLIVLYLMVFAIELGIESVIYRDLYLSQSVTEEAEETESAEA